MSEGAKYQALAPSAELLDPHRAGKDKSLLGWAYCARTPDRGLFLLYFEQDCPPPVMGSYGDRYLNSLDGRVASAGVGHAEACRNGRLNRSRK